MVPSEVDERDKRVTLEKRGSMSYTKSQIPTGGMGYVYIDFY